MKKRMVFTVILFVLAGSMTAITSNELEWQDWKETEITFIDSKDRGILKAEYNVRPQRGKDCILTIRLTNMAEKPIAHYWFKFLFTDGRMHENNMTDHQPNESFEMTYASCAIKSIEITEVEW